MPIFEATIFEKAVKDLLQDDTRVTTLLAREKEYRGLPAQRTAFVGMHNIAYYWWCAQQAVLTSRDEELVFFRVYLCDRLLAAHRLGYVSALPQRDEEILTLARGLGLAERERLFKAQAPSEAGAHGASGLDLLNELAWHLDPTCAEDVAVYKMLAASLAPDIPELREGESIEIYCEADTASQRPAVDENTRVMLARAIARQRKMPALRRGNLLEVLLAERYPTFRWHFPWQDYIVIGVPDGLTETVVYEFKTTGSLFFLPFVKPAALTQGDLYGYFFQRPTKRVQIYVIEKEETVTYEGPVDPAAAEKTLQEFVRVEKGGAAHPPKAWKCRICKYQMTCALSQARPT